MQCSGRSLLNTSLGYLTLSSRVGGRRSTLQAYSPTRTRATMTKFETVVVGGGNAAGYVAKAFVEAGAADGKLCIIGEEGVAPYERPALTKAYLFPLDKSPARLPGFHTSVGGGGDRQTVDWYRDKGIELMLGTKVTKCEFSDKKVVTAAGGEVEYDNLIIATGCEAAKLPAKIGGSLEGVFYVRNVQDGDKLVAALESAGKVCIIGGGYIGMECAAAITAWNKDITVLFPESNLMERLFTPDIAAHYESLFASKGVKFEKGVMLKEIVGDEAGKAKKVVTSSGQEIEADVVIVGIGARADLSPFQGIEEEARGIKVDGNMRTSIPDVYAVGDIAAFPLQYTGGELQRMEHVANARSSAAQAVKALLNKDNAEKYDYVPFFYSRMFEHPGSERKISWQFYGENKGDVTVIGDFNPKLMAVWVEGGSFKGIFLESGSPEEFGLLKQLAVAKPTVDASKLTSLDAAFDYLKTLV